MDESKKRLTLADKISIITMIQTGQKSFREASQEFGISTTAIQLWRKDPRITAGMNVGVMKEIKKKKPSKSLKPYVPVKEKKTSLPKNTKITILPDEAVSVDADYSSSVMLARATVVNRIITLARTEKSLKSLASALCELTKIEIKEPEAGSKEEKQLLKQVLDHLIDKANGTQNANN